MEDLIDLSVVKEQEGTEDFLELAVAFSGTVAVFLRKLMDLHLQQVTFIDKILIM